MATPIPENQAAFSIAEIVASVGGWASRPADGSVRGVATDTRGDVQGKLFVALEGEHFDGHAFVPSAVERGAAAVLVSREPARDLGVPAIVVSSTLDALGEIALVHRRRWGGTLIAVGGSAGKTTTRSAVTSALDALFPGETHYARGNLNNRVGVPMVLLGLAPRHRFAVVEVGTNVRGEVATLARVCRPEIALLTLIGIEHAAGIGDIDAIELEEGDLYAALGGDGAAIGNGDDARVVRQMARSPARTRLRYGVSAICEYRLVRREPHGLDGARLAIERPGGPLSIECSLVGEPGALAVLAAVAVADRIAGPMLEPARLAGAFSGSDVGEPGRLRPVELADGTVLIDDTYNSNPASVLASVATARELAASRGARLVLVLGEMRELGATSEREHTAIGHALARGGAAALVCVGGDARFIAATALAAGLDAVYVEDAAQAVALVLMRVQARDVVLVKASRGVRAERVVEGLVQARGRAA